MDLIRKQISTRDENLETIVDIPNNTKQPTRKLAADLSR